MKVISRDLCSGKIKTFCSLILHGDCDYNTAQIFSSSFCEWVSIHPLGFFFGIFKGDGIWPPSCNWKSQGDPGMVLFHLFLSFFLAESEVCTHSSE